MHHGVPPPATGRRRRWSRAAPPWRGPGPSAPGRWRPWRGRSASRAHQRARWWWRCSTRPLPTTAPPPPRAQGGGAALHGGGPTPGRRGGAPGRGPRAARSATSRGGLPTAPLPAPPTPPRPGGEPVRPSPGVAPSGSPSPGGEDLGLEGARGTSPLIVARGTSWHCVPRAASASRPSSHGPAWPPFLGTSGRRTGPLASPPPVRGSGCPGRPCAAVVPRRPGRWPSLAVPSSVALSVTLRTLLDRVVSLRASRVTVSVTRWTRGSPGHGRRSRRPAPGSARWPVSPPSTRRRTECDSGLELHWRGVPSMKSGHAWYTIGHDHRPGRRPGRGSPRPRRGRGRHHRPLANGEPVTVIDAIEAATAVPWACASTRCTPSTTAPTCTARCGSTCSTSRTSCRPSPAPAFHAGGCELVPNNFSEVPRLLRETTRCSLVAAAAPPDRHGYFSLGTNCDYAATFIGRVPFFLEVNERMPRTFGRNQVHASQIVGWTRVDRPLVEVPGPARRRRARHRRPRRRADPRRRHHPGRHRRHPQRPAGAGCAATGTSACTPSCCPTG